jgi:large subunit ribosomal protein L13
VGRRQVTVHATAEPINVGPDPWNRTYYPKGAHADNSKKPWYIIDAEGQTLGRLASLAASKIRGKTVSEYTPSMDMGGYVIVINAEKVQVGGDKENQKLYYRHTGRPGSLKTETFKHLQKRIPERIVEKSIKGMLPKGRLGRSLFNHLKVFKGSKHPHAAQRAQDITPIISAKPAQLATEK